MKEQKRAREEEKRIERETSLAACLFNSRLSLGLIKIMTMWGDD
jgi:hypothetical protein